MTKAKKKANSDGTATVSRVLRVPYTLWIDRSARHGPWYAKNGGSIQLLRNTLLLFMRCLHF
jgi:hypothetical protein